MPILTSLLPPQALRVSAIITVKDAFNNFFIFIPSIFSIIKQKVALDRGRQSRGTTPSLLLTHINNLHKCKTLLR